MARILIGIRRSEIQRARRSPLSAECPAAGAAGDYALRYRIMLVELVTHNYHIRKLSPPSDCPMLNPFNIATTDLQLKTEELYEASQIFDPSIAREMNHRNVTALIVKHAELVSRF